MIPLRPLTSMLLAVTLVAGCGGAAAEMARVGDTVVTEGDLAALYESRSVPVGEELRGSLYRLIALRILVDAMEDEFALELDRSAVDAVYRDMVNDIEGRGLTPAQALNIPNAGLGMVRFNAELAVLRDLVVGRLVSSPEFLDILFEERVGVTTVCVRHVLVETRDEALEVRDRVEAGEDIGDLADELSFDPSPRGDLGCRLASAYVTQFARAAIEAPLEEAHGPVETEFGWHVLVVSARSEFDRAEVESDPLSHLAPTDLDFAWFDWVNAQLRAADVEVAARFGTWTPTSIRPPSDG